MVMDWSEQCNYFYYLCGITVGSNRPLGFDVPLSHSEPDTCIIFRPGDKLQQSASEAPSLDDTWYRLSERIQAEGWIREDGRFALLYTTQADPDLYFFLVRQVIPFLAGLQKRLVLHASAVQVDEKAYAFVAGSGAGKSTLAKALSVPGVTPVADDLLPVAWGNKNSLALTVDTVSGTLQKIPLACIVFLSREDNLEKPSMERIGNKEYMLLLLRNSFAEMSIHRLWRFQFETYGKLIESVEAVSLIIPNNLDLLPETAKQVYLQLLSFRGQK